MEEGLDEGQTALEVRFLAPLRPDEEVYLSDSGQEGRNAVYLRTKQEGREIFRLQKNRDADDKVGAEELWVHM